jgi:hypothetical protein
LGEARDSLEDITKEKRFAVGVTEEREETKFCEGGEGNGRHINADRLRRGKNGNGMEESVDSGKGGCVGPYFIIYVFLSPPIVHLTLLFLSLCTSSHFFNTRLR